MLRWTVTFLIGAIVAASFQFGGIAEGPASVAKLFYFIFLALCILSVFFDSKPGRYTFIKLYKGYTLLPVKATNAGIFITKSSTK